MSAKKTPAAKPAAIPATKPAAIPATKPAAKPATKPAAKPATKSAVKSAAAALAADDWLLVCLQDPFEAVGDSSSIGVAMVASADGNSSQLWRLEAVMALNPPRFFQSWATRGVFTLNLSVHAVASPAKGTWGDTVRSTSGSGNCRVTVSRDTGNKLRFSLAKGARRAAEKPMPRPETQRFLNADVAFELNGGSGVSAGAVAVISGRRWSRLIIGTDVTTDGLAFDGKWRRNLDDADGDASVAGSWSFAVMTRPDYETLCHKQRWVPYILDA